MSTPKKDESGRAKRLSGSVRPDERGHAVWQWATDSARNAINSTSALLRKLEVPGLSVQDDVQNAKDKAKASAQDAARAQAYSSYNAKRSELPKAAASARATKAPAPKPARSSWWHRLLRRD